MVGADIFSIKNYMLLCIVEYYIKFSVMKKNDSLTASDIVEAAKIIMNCGYDMVTDNVTLQ